MTTIYKGFYDSRNFSFEFFANSKDKALKGIRKVLLSHAKQYDLEKDWFYKDDIFVHEYKLDVGYRDMQEVK